MPKATKPNGDLIELDLCLIKTNLKVPGAKDGNIHFYILPDISDSKSASYNDEPIIGRSNPLKTYSHSENRAISWTAHFIATKTSDLYTNAQYLRIIQALVYPQDGKSGTPFTPPPIVKLKCGNLLADGEDVCAVLKSYSVKFPTDTVWDESTYIPYKFDVEMQFEVVYGSDDLPGAERIVRSGR